MTVADDVETLILRQPGLTEAQIAEKLFGGAAYQQRVNSASRHLILEGRIERNGKGGPGDPFTYRSKRKT